MLSLDEKNISQTLFISPIVDMEKLIMDMMKWLNITEDELKSKKEVETEFGETLSWEYLSYVKNHPIRWNVPTSILYGEKDNLSKNHNEVCRANWSNSYNHEEWRALVSYR